MSALARERGARHVDIIHAAAAAQLAGVHARYTERRRALVDALANARQPLTVEEIRAIAAIPQSSIYRNLPVLEDADLVHRLTNSSSEFARYELAETLLGHHHHLTCAACGTMTDVTLPDDLEAALARSFARLATERAFRVERHRLDILGTCANCAASRGRRP